jgi:hypothetical protein
MNMTTAIYLRNKVRQSLSERGLDIPDVDVYNTALGMLQGIWPLSWPSMLEYYTKCVADEKYTSAYVDESGELLYHHQVYRQPSINKDMCLLGLATEPAVSVTFEGCGMREFTFSIFHEIAHIFYKTRNEVTCNSFALLYNNLLWATPAARKGQSCLT